MAGPQKADRECALLLIRPLLLRGHSQTQIFLTALTKTTLHSLYFICTDSLFSPTRKLKHGFWKINHLRLRCTGCIYVRSIEFYLSKGWRCSNTWKLCLSVAGRTSSNNCHQQWRHQYLELKPICQRRSCFNLFYHLPMSIHP